MSGGLFDYKDSSLKYEVYGFADEPGNVFEDVEISRLVWDVLDLVHEFDWYRSGDTSEDTWLEKKAAFKEKWFERPREERFKEIIDSEIEKTRAELYRTFLPGSEA